MKKKRNLIFAVLLLVPLVAYAADTVIRSDKLKLGKAATGNKTIEFDINGGANNPKIQWNQTDGKMTFSEDGTSFKAFGSGAGGGGGINILPNGDFEAGTVGWTASGGAFTATTSGSEIGNGLRSGKWTPSGNQNLRSAALAIPVGLFGRNCMAKVLYSTTEATSLYTLKALDGSNNVLGSATLSATPSLNYREDYVTFICPSSGSIKLSVENAATSAFILLDDAHLGSNLNIANVSQAQFIGSGKIAQTASCIWTRAGDGVFGPMDGNSSCPGPTIQSNPGPGTILTTDTDLPQFTVNNLPPGTYQVVMHLASSPVSTTIQCTAIYDGIGYEGRACNYGSTAGEPSAATMVGLFTYTTTGNRTFAAHVFTQTGTKRITNDCCGQELHFSISRFPTAQEQAIRMDQAAWRVDATIAGANISLGAGNTSSYTEMASGSLTLNNATGGSVYPAKIACSGTNPPGINTCSAGSETNGINFDIPRAGEYLACVSFEHSKDMNTGNGSSIDTAFEIMETPSNAQTILQEGKTRLASAIYTHTNGMPMLSADPYRLCGTFQFATVGNKTLRVMFEQTVTGTPTASQVAADQNGSIGQRDIHWEVYPISYNWPMPVIVNSVTTPSTGRVIVTAAQISGGGSLDRSEGNWISSLVHNGTGDDTLNFVAGTFASTPICTCTVVNGAANRDCTLVTNENTNSIQVRRFAVGAAGAEVVNVMCIGPK